MQLIKKITRQTIWEGRQGGTTWFHPRVGMLPGQPNPTALMTCQSISGSDYFGQVYFSTSTDLGKTWSAPEAIHGLGRRKFKDGIEEGVCDVVPVFHKKSGALLAIGHNVYYKDGKLTMPDKMRHPAFVVRDKTGKWSDRWKLVWDDPRGSRMYTSGCAQRLHLDNGQILIPISFAPTGQGDRMVGSVLCEFNGSYLQVLKSGNELSLAVRRGLLEPSITRFKGRYFMTIRAEDTNGYNSISDDGLNWSPIQPWWWDDGEPLTMSTTQQHWLTHSDGLFLVYTRKARANLNVIRWRAPIYAARVDPEKMQLIRETEQIVFPLIGEGIHDPDHVALMGNFHVTNATPDESWVTVGENLPRAGWRGNTLLARISWSRPNKI